MIIGGISTFAISSAFPWVLLSILEAIINISSLYCISTHWAETRQQLPSIHSPQQPELSIALTEVHLPVSKTPLLFKKRVTLWTRPVTDAPAKLSWLPWPISILTPRQVWKGEMTKFFPLPSLNLQISRPGALLSPVYSQEASLLHLSCSPGEAFFSKSADTVASLFNTFRFSSLVPGIEELNAVLFAMVCAVEVPNRLCIYQTEALAGSLNSETSGLQDIQVCGNLAEWCDSEGSSCLPAEFRDADLRPSVFFLWLLQYSLWKSLNTSLWITLGPS